MQRHLPEGSPRWPQAQGFVAFFRIGPIRLKWLKPKEPEIEPQTLGEHIKYSRLQRKLSQEAAARLLGVDESTVLNWEKGHTEPPIHGITALLQFLGYDPFPEPKTLPQHMLAKRQAMGWSIREAARALGVHPDSWADWERGQTTLLRRHRVLVARILNLPFDDVDREMRARWNQSHEKGTKTDEGRPSI